SEGGADRECARGVLAIACRAGPGDCEGRRRSDGSGCSEGARNRIVTEPRTIAFTVPAVPVAQPRQRHRVALGATGKQWVQNYTPRTGKAQDFKATVRMAAREIYEGPPIDGPIELAITFIMPRPGKLRWKTRAMPRCWHCTKPDIDNLAKCA